MQSLDFQIQHRFLKYHQYLLHVHCSLQKIEKYHGHLEYKLCSFLVAGEKVQTHNENNIINLKYFINKLLMGKTTKYIHIFNDISLHFSMYSNIILSQEEKFLINILFKGENELNNKSFRLLDYEKLVKNVNSHLMIPALYINLKKKNLKKPVDPNEILKKYIEDLYTINIIRLKHF